MRPILATLLCAFTTAAWGSSELPEADSVLVDKSERKMWLIAGGIALGIGVTSSGLDVWIIDQVSWERLAAGVVAALTVCFRGHRNHDVQAGQ